MPLLRQRHELLHTRLERFTKTLPAVESGEVRAIHRARVGSRRLRELVPVLQLDPEEARKLEKRLRKATRRLGGLRELDVVLAVTDELRESGQYGEQALQRVAADIRAQREKKRAKLAYGAAADELKRISRKLEKIKRRLELSSDTPAVRRAWQWALDARMARRGAALKDAMDEAGSMYLPGRVHGVRIALKKLRYATEVVDEAGARSMTTELRLLRRVQRLLGRLHDLQVLVDHVRRVQAALDPPDLALWQDLGRLVTGLEQSLRRLHARYVRDRDAVLEIAERLAARGASRGASRRAAG
jgi:CHAD domain-containing protein